MQEHALASRCGPHAREVTCIRSGGGGAPLRSGLPDEHLLLRAGVVEREAPRRRCGRDTLVISRREHIHCAHDYNPAPGLLPRMEAAGIQTDGPLTVSREQLLPSVRMMYRSALRGQLRGLQANSTPRGAVGCLAGDAANIALHAGEGNIEAHDAVNKCILHTA